MTEAKPAPRKTYATLDGLRGVAALAVVTYHASDLFGLARFTGAYLAVDLFFCLSGFVIAHAYGSRLAEGMGVVEFMRIRLIRLYPLFALSLLPGILIYAASATVGHGSVASAVATAMPLLLFLPSPLPGSLYMANAPGWSLFYELVVNIVAAALWRRLSNAVLFAVVAFSAMAVAVLGLEAGSLDYGFLWSEWHFALSRVTYSFFAGILIYRYRDWIGLKVPPVLLIAAVLLLFWIAPSLGGVGVVVIALAVLPAIVALGSAVEPRGALPYAVIGRLSYAVYVFHVPLLAMFRQMEQRASLPMPPAPLAGVLLLIVLLALCWFADRFFDAPVRNLLTARTKFRRTAGPKQTAF